jgi:type IV secretion system protein VirD4
MKDKMQQPQIAEARLVEIVDAPLDRIAELTTTILHSLNYRIKIVNEKQRKVAAFENKIDQRDRLTWRLEFDVRVSWRQVPKGAEVTVTVVERINHWSKDQCQKRCAEILDALHDEAQLANEIEKSESASTQHGSARWATTEDIEQAGYITDTPESKRLLLGPGPNSSLICGTVADTEMHCLLRGPTGSGKTSRFIIPQEIMRLETSAIVTEATAGNEAPDVYTKTAGWKAEAGHKIYYFNPDDLTSVRFNPVDLATTVNNAQEMADLIVENTSLQRQYGGDPIWPTSERHLLTALLLFAHGEKGHLGQIRRILRLGADGIGMMLMQSVYQEARDEFMGFYRVSSEGFRNGVISGLMSRLNLWVSPRIVALTEKTDFDVNQLPNEKFTFYLAVPSHKERLKPLAVLMFNFLLKLAVQREFKYGLHLTLDELMQFNRIPGFAEALTIIRHRHIPVLIGIQSNKQPIKVYGREEASILMDMMGTTISLRPRDYLTAKDISQALGTRTIVERKTTSGGHIVEREFGRSLIEPSEVLTLDTTKAIVQTPSTPPILLDCFDWRQFVHATKIPPPERRQLEVSEQLTRICREVGQKPDWQKLWETEKKKHRQTEKEDSVQERGEERQTAKRSRYEKRRRKRQEEEEQETETDDYNTPPAI